MWGELETCELETCGRLEIGRAALNKGGRRGLTTR
jgi:hypothetical protein